MFSVIANPTDTKPTQIRKFNFDNFFNCKSISAAGRTSHAAGGVSYNTSVIFSVGGTDINSFFAVPEDSTFFDLNAFGAFPYCSTYNNVTGGVRIMVPYPCGDGQTAQGFFWKTFSLELAGSGVTGTATIALKKMSLTSGTLTTIATTDIVISADVSNTSIFVNGASPVSLTSDDVLVFDISVAPTTGTHNTTNYVSVWVNGTSNGILTIF